MSFLILTVRSVLCNSKCVSSTALKSAGGTLVNENTSLNLPLVLSKRNATSFFNKLTAAQIWKGITSVSNAGRKRGRGKRGGGSKLVKDLNRGQVIGVGKANIIWPGLTAPVIRGREIVSQQQLPPDTEREAKLIKLRDQMGGFRRLKLSSLERGWCGTKLPGRSLGPPDPVGEDTFEGFDTIVLEHKGVFHMEAVMGRTRSVSTIVVTGNGNGVAGFAKAVFPDTQASVRNAKNRAAQKLMYFERYNNHTVYHDFYQRFYNTRLFVQKKPEGYGLVCHRAIREICKLVGIKDIYVKVEGSTNVGHIVRAFFIGLMRQKTHQEIAEQKGLHLVELRKEHSYFPVVVGSPKVCRTKKEPDEIMDLTQYMMDGKVVLKKKKLPPFYTFLPSWQKYLARSTYRRNHDKVRFNLRLEYDGELQSFHFKDYPECRQERLDIHRRETPPRPEDGN